MDPLKPSVALLAKLGSIAVHAEEMTSPGAHPFDAEAVRSLMADPEVTQWMDLMRGMAMLPRKRSEDGR